MSHPSLSQTLKHRFRNLEIPHGALFYPCCGHDLRMPIELFVDSIEEFHFVDCYFMPGFGRNWSDGELVPARSGDAVVLPEDMVLHVSDAAMTDQPVDDSTKEKFLHPDQWKRISDTETPRVHFQRWTVATTPPREIAIYRHWEDGLSTFRKLDTISVFFLRRDSMGEGGSGQMWFQEKLLALILEKLVDGGLLVTDGSGRPDDFPNYDRLPWSSLWRNRAKSADKDQLPGDFACFGRRFKCIGYCGEGYGPVYAWQVSAMRSITQSVWNSNLLPESSP